MKISIGVTVAALAVASGLASQAEGVNIAAGSYRLHNHPDGNARPPLYGLRLDELFNVTSDHDIFTFDFDAVGSAMYLDYNGSTIHIYGTTYGGRDTGNAYANDVHRGFYSVNFTYTYGVGIVAGDDDLFVDPPANQVNYGLIHTPGGQNIALWDGHYGGDQLDFRFGDTDNDLGHRGYAGISGWGWLFHGPAGAPYVGDSDWLFTAQLIPAPGMASVLMGAGVLASRRRRR